MSLPLEFSFNQKELESMLENAATAKIVVSLCNVPEKKGPSELYLCAQAYDSGNTLIDSETLAVGCPNPPGWQKVSQSLVKKAGLKYSPKFSIDKTELKPLLKKNKFEQDGIKKVMVELGSRIVMKPSKETKKNVSSAESFILFKITGADASPASNPRKDTKGQEANPF